MVSASCLLPVLFVSLARICNVENDARDRFSVYRFGYYRSPSAVGYRLNCIFAFFRVLKYLDIYSKKHIEMTLHNTNLQVDRVNVFV